MQYVILSYPRCGTHLTRYTLSQHPSLSFAGEIFNPYFKGEYPWHSELAQDPAAMIQRTAEAGYNGFCVHRGRDLRVTRKSGESVLDWICRERPHVIWLHRKDQVRRATSMRQAQRDRRFIVREGQPAPPAPVRMTPAQLQYDIERYIQDAQQVLQRL
jgi:hypothetical protein